MERTADREQRAREIFQTASQVLCEMGYEKASIRDLANAAGMTKAGLYYYFQSKEELLYKILDSYMDDLLSGIALLDRQPDPSARLRAFIRFQVNLYCRDTYRSKLIIHDENCLSAPLFKQLKDKQRQYLAYWKRALQELGQREGLSARDLSAHTHFLVGTCNWIYQWYDPQGPLTPEELANKIYNLFLNGLRVEAALP